MLKSLKRVSLFTVILWVGGCGGGSSSNTGNNNFGVSVSVSPKSTSVIVGQSTGFTATVTGTTNMAVTWNVNDVAGGNATVGRISSTGTYTAPAAVPNPATVTVKAVSQADPTKSGAATVAIVATQTNQNPQAPPIKLGTTGSNANDFKLLTGGQIECCTGTLGSLLQRSGNFYILSNNHVLDRGDAGTVGDNIIQPGLGDNNCTAAGATVVANLSQAANLENSSTNVDAAIAQIVGGEVDTTGTILSLGATAAGTTPNDGPPHAGAGIPPSLNLAVAKSGRTTGLTCSTISATSITVQVTYEKGCGGTTFTHTFSGQISVAGGSFSLGGDSGSLIVSQATADPVALLFAGSNTDTVGNPVGDVLAAMADAQGNKPAFVGSAAPHAVIGCTLPSIQSASQVAQPQAAVSVTSQAMQRAAAARDFYAGQMLKNPYVRAVGIGKSLDHPGEPAILLAVDAGQPRSALPAQLDGIRTRIVTANSTTPNGVLGDVESETLAPAAVAFAVTTLSDAEMSRAETVHAAHAQELLKLAGVQGVGITSSADAPGEAALMIFTVRGARQDPIPDVIDGVRTRIRESSPFKAGLGGAKRKTCAAPPAVPRPVLHGPSH
jgi:hypothetical protein